MNDLPRQKLREIIAQYGRSVCDNPQQCKGLLLDQCGDYRREVNVLIAVLEEHVVDDLMHISAGVPTELVLTRLSQRMCDNQGMDKDAARWGVESWALALGMSVGIAKAPRSKPPKKKTEAEVIDETEVKGGLKEETLPKRSKSTTRAKKEPSVSPSKATEPSSPPSSDGKATLPKKSPEKVSVDKDEAGRQDARVKAEKAETEGRTAEATRIARETTERAKREQAEAERRRAETDRLAREGAERERRIKAEEERQRKAREELRRLAQKQSQQTIVAKKEPPVSSVAPPLEQRKATPQQSVSKSSSCGGIIGIIVVIIIVIVSVGSCISNNINQQNIQSTATAQAADQATQDASNAQATQDAANIQATQDAANAQATQNANAQATQDTMNAQANPTPDSSQAATLITTYYDNNGVFAGTYVLKKIDQLTYGPLNGNQFTACAAYEYAVPSTPSVTAGTDSRTFLFEYTNSSWQVISMGDALSC